VSYHLVVRWRITIAVTCAALLAMTACSDRPDVDLAESTAAVSETQRTASVPIGMPSVEQAVQPTPVAELRLRGTRLLVQVLCDFGLVGGGPVLGELGWGEVTVGGVWSVDVVVDAPVFDEDLGFEEAVELPAVEELVA